MALGLKTATLQANTLPLTAIGLRRGGAAVHLGEVGRDGPNRPSNLGYSSSSALR